MKKSGNCGKKITSHMRHCIYCNTIFVPTKSNQTHCSSQCAQKHRWSRTNRKIGKKRYCRQCGKEFIVGNKNGNNKQHCSDECSVKSARESVHRFFKKNPNAHKKYYKNHKKKYGADSYFKRLYRQYPNAPKWCQACGEDRVLHRAHKPEFALRGAWKNKNNTSLDKIWLLCPTCHYLLDYMGYTKEQLRITDKSKSPINIFIIDIINAIMKLWRLTRK